MHKKYWIGAIAGLGILDWYCANVKHEGTLSQAGRETFRTNTAAGKIAWIVFWVSLSSWLVPHVIKWPEQVMEIVDEIS